MLYGELSFDSCQSSMAS